MKWLTALWMFLSPAAAPPDKPEPPRIIPATTPSDAGHKPAPVAPRPPPPAPTTKGGLKPVDAVKLLATFRSYVGIREQPPGSNNGSMVDRFNASCGFKPADHAPWCASVAHYGYLVNGADDRPGAYSPDWYRKSRVIPPQDARPGDVALVYFPSKGRYAHTIACIESVNRAGRIVSTFTTLEGNTNAQGSREGDQFARRIRAADSVTVVRWQQ